MMMNMGSAAKEKLLHMIEALPEEEILAVQRFVEFVQHRSEDPVRHALDKAPVDDEPVTDEDAHNLAEAREEMAQGVGVSEEEMKRRLGL